MTLRDNFRRQNTIGDFLNNHPIIDILTTIVVMFSLFIAVLAIAIKADDMLSYDVTEPSEIKNPHVYEITVNKHNGLKTVITIESANKIKVNHKKGVKRLYIFEPGKNSLDIEIDNDIMIENVNDYKIKKIIKKKNK